MAGNAINGKDLEASFGLYFDKGATDDLLKQPKPKKYYQHDWQDRNGVEIDPTEPIVYESRSVGMSFILIANSRADFFSKYAAFVQEISKPGVQKWYIEEFGKNYYLKLENTGNFSRLTRLQNTDRVVSRFAMTFIEPSPEVVSVTPAPTPGTGITIDWGYSTSPIFGTNYAAINFQFTGSKSENSPALNFTQAANFKYLVIRTAATAKTYLNWSNTQFNYGKFPDQLFNAPVESGGYRYYITRTEALLDKDNSTITLS